MPPTVTLTTAQAMAGFVEAAAASGRRLTPTGSGTKRERGGRHPGESEPLSTLGLRDGLQHFAGDLVAVVPAGLTLAETNAALAPAGQWLPIDAPWPDRATIGGIVATNDSGPRRQHHGAPRDLILGIEVVLADGRVARAGGRVVKNVAGYDLSRLLCGSHGSLGVITSATFKLAPLAASSLTVVARCPGAGAAVAAAATLSTAPITPVAIELQLPAAALLVRFESTAAAARAMSQLTAGLLQDRGAAVDLLEGADEREAWAVHTSLAWRAATVLKVAVLPTEVTTLLDTLAACGVEWTCTGRLALGVMIIGLDGDGASVARVIDAIRAAAGRRGGHLTPLRLDDSLRGRVALAQPGAVRVMQALKARFDPRSIFPPLAVAESH